MSVREPPWWYAERPGLIAKALTPFGRAYGVIAAGRLMRADAYRAGRPVICIGNFTAGGSGKTPLTMAAAAMLRDLGREPWALSRGYGGSLPGPVRVDLRTHTASDVGDEPMMLADVAATVISRDRRAGAQMIETLAPKNAVIVMDDGLQNPDLRKDMTIAVVDRTRGVGNGLVVPAGPLRAPLSKQLKFASALVVNGDPQAAEAPSVKQLRRAFGDCVIDVFPRPSKASGDWRGVRVVAFAGIANPERFFALLEKLGAEIVERRAFADHQHLSETQARGLLRAASRSNATLATTQKDAARLVGGSGARAELAESTRTLSIELNFADAGREKLEALIVRAIG